MKWFVGALVLLLIAVVFNLPLLAYAMYALLGIMVASRLLARSWAASLRASRQCDRLTAQVGETIPVSVTVENTGWLPIPWVLLEDLLSRHALLHEPPNLGVEGERMKLAMFWPHGKKQLKYTLKCNRRGYYQIGPLVLETGDLFGLHRRYRVAAEPHYLLVYPQVVPLSGYDVSSKRPIGEVRMTYRLFEDPTRISGVREYEAGDPLNRVHWHATARTGILHSKIYEPSTVAGATILLDFHQKSHAPKDEPYRSELAITAAASIAHAVYTLGQQVGLVTNGRDAADRIRVEGWKGDVRTRQAARQKGGMMDKNERLAPLRVETRRGPEQFMRILETLARLELTDGLNLPQLVLETTNRLPRDATVIAILPVVSHETAIALGNLRRRGFAVTAMINLYEDYDFSVAAGPLMAEGIETRHLKDPNSVADICRSFALAGVR
jgi:uncharacterized protein (DUF58 family)